MESTGGMMRTIRWAGRLICWAWIGLCALTAAGLIVGSVGGGIYLLIRAGEGLGVAVTAGMVVGIGAVSVLVNRSTL